MATNVFSVLNTAKVGLLAQQLAIEVTGNNIANVETEGYSRQEVGFEAKNPRSFSLGQLGTGVNVVGVKRAHDQFLFSQILGEGETLGQFEVRKDVFEQLEILFSESNGQGLNQSLGNSFQPSKTFLQTLLVCLKDQLCLPREKILLQHLIT